MSALRELIAFFGTEVDVKPLEHAGEKMKGLAEIAEKAAVTIGLAFGLHELNEFIKGQIEAGNQVMNTAEILGVAADELKEFRYAAYQADVGADEADTALRFLNKNMGEAANGAGNAAATFARLGVKMKDQAGHTRPAIDVMGDLADGISKLDDPAKETATAMELFGRAGAKLIPLLHKGSKGIAELSAEYRELTEGAAGPSAEVLEEAEHQQKRLETASKGLKAVLAADLIPAFTAVVSWVTDLVHAFRAFADHSYIVQTALGTLGAVAVALAVIWGILNIEILLVVAAVALMILVVDDIYTAFKGGKSVIGDFIDSIFGIGTTKKVFDDMKDWAEDAYLTLQKVVNGIKVGVNAIRTAYNEVKHAATYSAFGDQKARDAEYEATKKSIDADLVPLLDKGDRLGQEGRNDALHQQDRKDGNTRVYEPSFDMAPRATVTAPGASSAVHNGNVVKENNVQVTVHGSNPKENADLVLREVTKAIADDDNQSAYAALPTGGGH